MQLLGKDTIVESYMGPSGDCLHKTLRGYQFGSGKDRNIVTSVEQVSKFAQPIQDQVKAWLADNGVFEATKEVMDREVSEQASEQPGTLDAMAAQLGPDVKANLFQMLKSALHHTGEPGFSTSPVSAELTDGVHETVDGKPVVIDSKGFKHPLPDPELVKHPRVVPVPGGVLLDKGNGHKELRMEDDGSDDLAEEHARIAEQEGRVAPKTKRAVARR